MSVDLIRFLSHFRDRGILLDAIILVVLTVGLLDPLLIARHKRTRENYSPEDYGLIVELFEFFGPRLTFTIPPVLTEVSNLLAQSADRQTRALFYRFSQVIAVHHEHYVSSTQVALHNQFATFGLTDIAILQIAFQNGPLIVTDDARFADFLGRQQIDVVKFQDLKNLDDE